ncbi:hypothetical protein BCR35DRAFT_292321 [Leucosporidium creatinivorum]|uniref:RING-type domain-containing protein n=1 Tax=Leucosporidium creatinivorum TaxID=106004 RepID=A0A1Y2F041_9BASI|nr:hypothetical protein BCR35DRAFT_292321 [Leucosporidium creatinivorum]
MDSPDSAAAPSTSAGPSPLSPLKRQGSAPPPDNPAVAQASKRLRSVLLDGADGAESGKGKGKQEEKSDTKDSLLADLEAQVTCGICQEVFYRPLALIPCLHTFCGSCLVPWLPKSSACPSCRVEATSASASHSSGRLVDLYLGLPGANEGRSAEEKASLDKIYTAGQVIVIGAREEDEDEEEGYTDEEDEQEDEEHGIYGEARPISYHEPCLYCPADSGLPYTCPRPIPNPATAAPELCIPDNHRAPGHLQCYKCETLSPADEVQWHQFAVQCMLCKVFSCGYDDCEDDDSIVPFAELAIPDGTVTTVLPHSFANLRSEQAILNDYLVAKGWSLADLARQVLFADRSATIERSKWLGPALENDPDIAFNSFLCGRCSMSCFEGWLMKWWMEERKTEAAKGLLDPQVVNRQDCWYGIDCRTAPHNLAHATRLNHLCPATRLPPPLPPAPPSGHRARGFEPGFPAPAFSHAQLTFRDLDGAPVLLSSHALPDGSKIPGKTVLVSQHGSLTPACLIGGEGHEVHVAGPAEVLFETDKMEWVRARYGVVPEGKRPVVGGVDAEGEELYHAAARTWKEGIRVPGKTNEAIGGASISWAWREWIVDEYDLLCWK